MTFAAKVGFIIIFIEMSINLTYYKDIIFAMATLVNFVGMLLMSLYRKNNYYEYDKHLDPQTYRFDKREEEIIQKWLVTMVTLNSLFLLTVMIHDFKSAFYLKAKEFNKRMQK